MDDIARITPEAKQTLASVMEKLSLSARSFHRILRIARTLADMNDIHNVESSHILRAISFRRAL